MVVKFACWTVTVVSIVVSGLSWRAADDPPAQGKFIPSFAVKYAGSEGWPDLEDAAKFDLIITGAGSARQKAHPSLPGNTWQVLKRMNPAQVILLYELGPGEYNTADWGRLGPGWEWIRREHGPGTADRWTAVGAKFGECLQGVDYANERLMLVGNPNWQQFWLDQVHAKHWGQPDAPTILADGVFADNTRYAIPWMRWVREGHRETPDSPADYSTDGEYRPEIYRRQMKEFLARALPWMAARQRAVGINFSGMAGAGSRADWQELDQERPPVVVAMEEGAFVHPWGQPQDCFKFYTEDQWLQQVQIFRNLRHVRAAMNVHGPVQERANDLGRMDSADAAGRRAWDVFWFALASFLLGYDDQRPNGYLNCTVWGYARFYWLREFDPQCLHLGRAQDEFRRVEGRTGHVYLREFQDGWVVVNPTSTAAADVAVPRGRARLIDHDALEQPESRPLVEQFNLAAQRAIVLLKEGRALGNADNGT